MDIFMSETLLFFYLIFVHIFIILQHSLRFITAFLGFPKIVRGKVEQFCVTIYYTNDENPGSGALDLAMLFKTIWVPLRLTTALEPSWSLLSVKDEYPRGLLEASGWLGPNRFPPDDLWWLGPTAPRFVAFDFKVDEAVLKVPPWLADVLGGGTATAFCFFHDWRKVELTFA